MLVVVVVVLVVLVVVVVDVVGIVVLLLDDVKEELWKGFQFQNLKSLCVKKGSLFANTSEIYK